VKVIASSEKLTQTERKDLGAFYTPAIMTDFCARWAIRTRHDTVLDPGCGDAAFLVSATGRLRELGAPDEGLSAQVHGIDLNVEAVRTAKGALQRVGVAAPGLAHGNFFMVRSEDHAASCVRGVDVLLGNPPYVRYQLFRNENRAAGLKAAARGGVILPALTSSWAPYVVHAASFLRPGGRLALVLPAELLHVGYAAAVREFLLREFIDLTLVSFEEKVFPGALEEVVLVLGTKGKGDGRLRVRRLHGLDDLDAHPEVVLASVRACNLKPGQRWLMALLEEEFVGAALEVVEEARFQPLGDLGRVDIGVVTGANDFFVMTDQSVVEHRLPESVLLKAVSKAQHVQGTRFSGIDWEVMVANGDPAHLLLVDEDTLKGPVARYIAQGEKRQLPERYKCRTREPWYRVPYVRKPDLFLTYMSNIAPRLVVNEAKATHTNTVHGVFLSNSLIAEPLAAAFLNSATLLSAEIEGRSYGGGVLKLEPGEAVKVLVPRLTGRVSELLSAAMPKLDKLVRGGEIDEASLVADRIVFGKKIAVAKREKIQSVLHALRARRLGRSRSAR
jgi:adenine-specific DNA methylase